MFKGLALRPLLPDLAALARSLAGVAIVAAVAVQWGPTGSVPAVVGTAAFAAATAFQDSPRSRVPLVYLVSALSGLAVLLGALTSVYSVLFVVVAALWCFGTAMLWAHGPNAGLIGAASAALLVVAPPVAPTVATALVTTALAVTGGLIQALVIALWPPQRWRSQREALVGAYRSLAADARKLADGSAGDGWAVDTEPLVALREAFTTGDGANRRRSAVYRGWYALPERIAATLTDTAGVPRSDALSRVLEEAADTMAAVADTSRSGRVSTDVAIGRFDSVAKDAVGSESGVVQRLSALLHEVVAMRLGDFVPSTPDAVRLRRPELPTSVRSAIRGVRGHVMWHSPVLRHAVRLSVAVALACAIDRYSGGHYGYWIPLTVLMVLRPETAHTYTRCVGRLAGVVAGIVVASTLLFVVDSSLAVATLLAVVAIGMTYVVSGFGYVAMSAAVTTSAVLVLDAGHVDVPPSMSDPLLAALVGGGLAVISHVVLPDDELTRLAQRAGELLKTEIDYAAAVIKGYVHELDSPADEVAAAWQRAYRARAAFEATTGAMRLDSRELRHWLRSYRTALNAVTSSCTTLEAHLPVRPATAEREFVLSVDEYVEALCGDPPTAASPWTVDAAELGAAEQRLREAMPRNGSDDGPMRVLVAEVGAITRSVSAISVSPAPSAAR
ncbi:FUSC family protein [Mycolicibacterium sp. BiH015]|uniref:FUSC family protein n=1 Tax=Mycolicibacterium sp. BiH015 TaxID=3018808 RepID=UPI0022E4D30C|nr:FUSC family protein [Mycolicibacterium sp. BiH015]MDA2895305.1 FUSC family protein [Mycolicibacterium sp. BiH015]